MPRQDQTTACIVFCRFGPHGSFAIIVDEHWSVIVALKAKITDKMSTIVQPQVVQVVHVDWGLRMGALQGQHGWQMFWAPRARIGQMFLPIQTQRQQCRQGRRTQAFRQLALALVRLHVNLTGWERFFPRQKQCFTNLS